MATRKRRAENANSGENAEIDFTRLPVPANADEHLLQIPESQRCLISLTGKGLERTLLWKLDWMNYMYAPDSISALCMHSRLIDKTVKYSPWQRRATAMMRSVWWESKSCNRED